jgi:aspartyl-tRNA synthetase
MRTRECGTLGIDDVGSSVTICGWVANHRDHGGVLFVDVRDASGLVQVVIDPESPGGAGVPRLRSEYVVRITGDVRARPVGTVNPELPTGQVEIAATAVEVLAESEPPPFPLDGRAADVDESLRLKYRYLDLRRPSLQRNLRLRAKVNHALRASMDEQRFVEVETPMLIASTPEGAPMGFLKLLMFPWNGEIWIMMDGLI